VSLDALDAKARVSVSHDGLRASLRIEPGVEAGEITVEAVRALLAAREVRPSSITDAAALRLSQARSRAPEEVVEEVVAEGVASETGEDGRFELAENLAHPNAGTETPADDESDAQADGGAVDHYSRSAFIVVEEDQVIGRLHEPTPGADGVDVRGRVIQGKSGRPCPLTFDPSVAAGEDGTVVSLQQGRLELTRTRLRVVQALTIRENVDFSTGHVDFPGEVIVRQGVRDCFEVRSGKNLEVAGLVEAATLHVQGSAILRQGMAGREKGTAWVGGDLEAKYLDGVSARVGGDLVVLRELTNCRVSVGRRLRSASCSVVGGEVIVAFGGEVRSIGGKANAQSVVAIGEDAELFALARMLMELAPQANQRAQQAGRELKELRTRTNKLTPAQAESMTELQFEVMNGQARREKIAARIDAVVAALGRLGGASLVVHREIMPGTIVRLGGRSAVFEDRLGGPVELGLDASGSPVARPPGGGAPTPLAHHAKMRANPGWVDAGDLESLADRLREGVEPAQAA